MQGFKGATTTTTTTTTIITARHGRGPGHAWRRQA